MAEQRTAGETVQHLGGRRLHPGSLTRGKDDDRKR
jgi:hypothetical protein